MTGKKRESTRLVMAEVLSRGKKPKAEISSPLFSNPRLIISDLVLGSNMAIDIGRMIEKYLDDFSHKRLEKPGRCEICGRNGCLNWHSKYWRKVRTLSGKRKIPIKRVRCTECGGTFPLLPVFILKYRRYGVDVILLALEWEKEKTCEKVVSELMQNYGLALDVLTVWLWKNRISKTTLMKLKKL